MVVEALVVGLWGIFAVELVSASLWTARPLTHARTHALTSSYITQGMLTAMFLEMRSSFLQTVLFLSTHLILPR
jgi:hypothetical protein